MNGQYRLADYIAWHNINNISLKGVQEIDLTAHLEYNIKKTLKLNNVDTHIMLHDHHMDNPLQP